MNIIQAQSYWNDRLRRILESDQTSVDITID